MTTPRQVAQRALDNIPGWRGATLTRLIGGRTNHAWLVELDERRAVLKADSAVRPAPFADRNAEAGVQRLAAKSGLASEVLFSSPSVLLSAYVDGEVWTKNSFSIPTQLIALAKTLRRVHALPLTGRMFDAPAAAAHYAGKIGKSVDSAEVETHVEAIRRCESTGDVRCCHNDLVAENILSTPDLILLDWEYAADNDPLFDLATVIAHHGLNAGQASCLLSAWCDGDERQFTEALQQQIKLYQSLYWLWRASRS